MDIEKFKQQMAELRQKDPVAFEQLQERVSKEICAAFDQIAEAVRNVSFATEGACETAEKFGEALRQAL